MIIQILIPTLRVFFVTFQRASPPLERRVHVCSQDAEKGREFLSRVVFLLNSQISLSLFFFSSSSSPHLHQRASGYQQPGPHRPQVHHEVERPLAAGASGGGGAGGLPEQRHPLPTERSQAAGQCLHFR